MEGVTELHAQVQLTLFVSARGSSQPTADMFKAPERPPSFFRAGPAVAWLVVLSPLSSREGLALLRAAAPLLGPFPSLPHCLPLSLTGCPQTPHGPLSGNSAVEIVFSQDGAVVFSIPLVSLESPLDTPCL